MAQDHTLTLNVSTSKPLYDMGTTKQSHGDRKEETLHQLGLKGDLEQGAGGRESKWNKCLNSNTITEPSIENRVANTRTSTNTASLRVHISMYGNCGHLSGDQTSSGLSLNSGSQRTYCAQHI